MSMHTKDDHNNESGPSVEELCDAEQHSELITKTCGLSKPLQNGTELTAEQDSMATVELDSAAAAEQGPALTAAQRARMERQRLRARALQDARLVRRPATGESGVRVESRTEVDSGGGFLLPATGAGAGAGAEGAPRVVAPPAPLVHAAEQPRCMDCGRSFPQSFLFDNFDYGVCDDCRDDEDAHSLITRTEAKSEFLLKDCDLDARPPPLRCVRRRNPHARRGDMRLYLRPQVEARAREVWGSEEALRRERDERELARERARHKQTSRRLRALRMDVRSSLYDRSHEAHKHSFGAERYDSAADVYERTCTDCGHVESYEKM